MNTLEGDLNSENIPVESPEKLLGDFKEEVATLMRQEEQASALKEQGTSVNSTSHFTGINLDELTLEDRDMLEIIKKPVTGNEDLLLNLFRNYQQQARNSGSASRLQFSAYIANKVTAIINKKWLS